MNFFSDITRSLFNAIEKTNLYVKVVWLGSNLNETFIEKNKNYRGNRSILFHHWWPDILSSKHDLTSVSFPECNGQKVSESFFVVF